MVSGLPLVLGLFIKMQDPLCLCGRLGSQTLVQPEVERSRSDAE